MKDELCRAFCNELSVREVPAGLVVSTPFRRADGDAIAFYVVRGGALPGMFRLEDDGQTIPYLEACGVDFETQTRAKAFGELLIEYGAEYDEREAIIHTPLMRETEIPRAAIRFAALLLRLSDFILLTQEHVESTFKEDAVRRIRERLGDRASVVESEPVSQQLAEVVPDLVLRATGRAPVAVFLGQNAQRIYEAIFLQMAALYEAREEVSVIALLEEESSVSREMRQRAANRLAAVPVYKGDELAAIQRIEREVLGSSTIH
jgi:uncharacterized protein DUF1828